MDASDYVPEGLTELQYGMHILQEVLGMPSTRSNIDLMAECLVSIGKSKRLEPVKAYKYLVRAIRLAKEQTITVDLNWFRNGEYVHIRPPKTVSSAGCDPGCRNRHGRGYHMNDVCWLYKRYLSMKDSLPNRQMTDSEIERLLSELDSKRANGAPDFRR